ncbi:MAG: nucleotidyltransferase domain-containing protein [Candidatus Anammoxibacter sp.]
MVENSIINIVQKFADSLKKQGIDIDKMVVYGSYAKGNPHPDSDIDLCVVSRNFGEDRIEEGMRLFRIAGDIDSRIEPIPVTLDSYINDTWLPLIYEIRSNGVEIPTS